MPAVLTPGGPMDLSSVLFRNRIIFIGQPVNSQVAQRVITQLVTLATIDENADILVCFIFTFLFLHYPFCWCTRVWKLKSFKASFIEFDCVLHLSGVSELPRWQYVLCVGNLWLHVLGKIIKYVYLSSSLSYFLLLLLLHINLFSLLH